ncbi:MAG: hypothetical protein COU33_04085 [Candidatus Magasanikbacteria bacterium CG10_big_fil_rev_8_21_14_0_10_43_6]|uniref:WxL domain-containing protein n=1 Tax=Candidatus Magasanikbacteria bacterium CG10_big_fil_rev_8_21_14_0_10_43_6 TaxID=1974650 RepID=A0A2M6W0G0_9BACT|nr:MAG: hypothetical protein COU33_04085 [Candidatus Magasanikbacteria bacterium CG10_big_fil_rev_8_21_14_0_10_43_6]
MKYPFSVRVLLLLFVGGISFASPYSLSAAMSGGNFNIYGDVFSSFGDSLTTGGSYALFETGGESGSNNINGGTFTLRAGFQALEQGTASLTLSTTTVSLGQLSAAAVSTATVTTTVRVDSSSGYALTIAESGDLADGAKDIDDVADGAVTAGSEEYGIKTAGGDGQLAADTALTGGSLTVASSNAAANGSATPVLFSASIDNSSTLQGSYTHTVTFTLTANP